VASAHHFLGHIQYPTDLRLLSAPSTRGPSSYDHGCQNHRPRNKCKKVYFGCFFFKKHKETMWHTGE
jgi:hypothetical protein